MFEKLVIVTRKTRLASLIERFNTRAQAKFYLEHAGLDFSDYEAEDDQYRRSLDGLHSALDLGLRAQVLDRSLVPTFLFGPTDLVVALGQDGLVANTAKYIGPQPLVGVNPDPARFDGTLLSFTVAQARAAVLATMQNLSAIREVTLAEARLSDGQRLLAFNDLFIGAQSHVSAHYRIKRAPEAVAERQSSSGVIVSTGAGCTGWMSSICTMVNALAGVLGGAPSHRVAMHWEDPRLFFAVREPFVSKNSGAQCAGGWVKPESALEIESLMPSGGVVFSDGVEADFLNFNSGVVAKIGAASQRARLVVATARRPEFTP